MKIHSNFTWQWFLVTCIGFLISLLLLEIGEKPDLTWRDGMMGGTLIGCAQALVLCGSFRRSWRWILACALSWALMASVGLGVVGWFAPRTQLLPLRLFYGAIWGTLAGAILGAGQAIVLKPNVYFSERWIPFSMGCWGVALALGWAVGGILYSYTHVFLSDVIGLTVTWMIVAITTGRKLIELLKY